MRTAKEKLEDNMIDEELVLIDEEAFRESLVGTTLDSRAVYDYDKMVEEFCECHNVSEEEAADYINYNILRGLSYQSGNVPIVVFPLRV